MKRRIAFFYRLVFYTYAHKLFLTGKFFDTGSVPTIIVYLIHILTYLYLFTNLLIFSMVYKKYSVYYEVMTL